MLLLLLATCLTLITVILIITLFIVERLNIGDCCQYIVNNDNINHSDEIYMDTNIQNIELIQNKTTIWLWCLDELRHTDFSATFLKISPWQYLCPFKPFTISIHLKIHSILLSSDVIKVGIHSQFDWCYVLLYDLIPGWVIRKCCLHGIVWFRLLS